MNEVPLKWVKQIHTALIDAKAIPLSGYAPAFSWEDLSEKLAELLQVAEFKVFPRKTSFFKESDITAGLGIGFLTVALNLTPLQPQAFWLMGKEDVAKLTALVVTLSQAGKGFSSSKFQEGFYYYLATQIVQAIDAMKTFGDLSLKIGKPATPPEEEALCIDVEMQHNRQTFWGRLVLPASFHQAFKGHFSTPQPASLTKAVAEQIDVSVRIELGQTQLSPSQWKRVNKGDLILLDRCTFDPTTHKGTAAIVLGEIPILRVRIKESHLKIVDYAYYREEQNPMAPETPENPEEDFEAEEEHPEEDLDTEDVSSEENHLWSTESVEELISPDEIPLTLSIEVARLRINLEKLLQLSPGNVLELPVSPEQGVDVIIGGKKVARGELVKLGEMLGVKILQMG